VLVSNSFPRSHETLLRPGYGRLVEAPHLSTKVARDSSAAEEAHSQVVFQCFDLKRHGTLGKEEMFGGLPKVQVLGDCTKHLEAKVFQLGHVMIMP